MLIRGGKSLQTQNYASLSINDFLIPSFQRGSTFCVAIGIPLLCSAPVCRLIAYSNHPPREKLVNILCRFFVVWCLLTSLLYPLDGVPVARCCETGTGNGNGRVKCGSIQKLLYFPHRTEPKLFGNKFLALSTG